MPRAARQTHLDGALEAAALRPRSAATPPPASGTAQTRSRGVAHALTGARRRGLDVTRSSWQLATTVHARAACDGSARWPAPDSTPCRPSLLPSPPPCSRRHCGQHHLRGHAAAPRAGLRAGLGCASLLQPMACCSPLPNCIQALASAILPQDSGMALADGWHCCRGRAPTPGAACCHRSAGAAPAAPPSPSPCRSATSRSLPRARAAPRGWRAWRPARADAEQNWCCRRSAPSAPAAPPSSQSLCCLLFAGTALVQSVATELCVSQQARSPLQPTLPAALLPRCLPPGLSGATLWLPAAPSSPRRRQLPHKHSSAAACTSLC